MHFLRYDPFAEFEEAFEEIPYRVKGVDLAADMYEDNGNLIVEMNIPGIEPDHIDIEVNENILRVTGSRKEMKESKDKRFYHKEIKRGSFERSMVLPMNVHGNKATAHFEHGVLKISLPKETTKEPHHVKIKLH